MCKQQFISLVTVVVVGMLTAPGWAFNIDWRGTAEDRDFSNPENWSSGTVPGAGDLAFNWARFTTEGPIIDEEVNLTNMGVAWGGGGSGPQVEWEITKGGNVTVSSNVWIGRSPAATNGGNGLLNITGGSLTVNATLFIGTGGTSVGRLNLGGVNGGTLIVNGSISFGDNGNANLDVQGGSLLMPDDQTELLQGHIDNGLITAWGNRGTLQLDYDITNEGQTTLTSVHDLNPSPAHVSTVAPGTVELSWTLPPHLQGQPVDVDVYYTDDFQALFDFSNPEAIQVVTKQNLTSVQVQAELKKQYYWAVDTYVGDPNDPILGPIFSFTADNVPPTVDTGNDIVTWLVEGVREGQLSATITDDGAIQPTTVQWTVVSEPNDPNNPDAVIADPTAESTTITLSALGSYVLQLDAFDGEYTGSDSFIINVYGDSCEASKALPDYVPLVGDLNGDCKVDEVDLALLQENMGKDVSLTNEWHPLD